MLLRMMRKSDTDGNYALQKQIVYSFGDHYYIRKDLRILNLLTGYKSFTFLFIPSLAESVLKNASSCCHYTGTFFYSTNLEE